MNVVGGVIISDVVPLKSRGLYQGCTLLFFFFIYYTLPRQTCSFCITVANLLFALGGAVGAPLGGWLGDTIGWYALHLSYLDTTKTN